MDFLVHWLRLHAPNAVGALGTWVPSLSNQISHAATKTQHSQMGGEFLENSNEVRTTYLLKQQISKQTAPMLVKMWNNRNSHPLLAEMQWAQPLWETVQKFQGKVKHSYMRLLGFHNRIPHSVAQTQQISRQKSNKENHNQ